MFCEKSSGNRLKLGNIFRYILEGLGSFGSCFMTNLGKKLNMFRLALDGRKSLGKSGLLKIRRLSFLEVVGSK